MGRVTPLPTIEICGHCGGRLAAEPGEGAWWELVCLNCGRSWGDWHPHKTPGGWEMHGPPAPAEVPAEPPVLRERFIADRLKSRGPM